MRVPCLLVLSTLLIACRPQSTTTPAPAAATYVDSRQCAACHAAIDHSYHQTGMAKAFDRPNLPATPAAKFFHKISGTWYAMLQHDGKLYQRRWQIGYQGREENVEELQVDYVMGSGNHVRTYLHRTARGTLIELPLAWYSQKGGYWEMNPGYDTPAPDTRRKIGYDCMFCHNAYPQIPAGHDRPDSEPVFSPNLPEGIDCQRCHGPGSEHLRLAQTAGSKSQAIRAAILNPARLTPERQMEVCMQCHLETTSSPLPNAIKRFDRGPFSYRPDEPLGNFMFYFDQAPATGHEAKFEIVNSAYRLRQSRCYLASAGKLTCNTCHDPHAVPRGEQAIEHYTQVCRQCHTATDKHFQQANCIACHMPKRRTDDVVHAVMTDHRIERRAPKDNALIAATYQGEVVPYYPATPDPLYAAVAQVSQKSNLAAGLPRLAAEIAKRNPPQPEFYIALGDAWRDQRDPKQAVAPYEEALKRAPQSVIAMKRLALALKDSGQFARLGEVLQNALKLAPEDPTLWFELGSFDSDEKRSAVAITELEKAIALDPDLAEAHQNLAVALAESGQFDRAGKAFLDALRIRPYDARTHANFGKLLVSKNDTAQALYEYQKAVALSPDYAEGHFDYGVLLGRENRLDEAQSQLQLAIHYNPQFAEAHDLLGTLLEMKQRTEPAEREYREALRIRPAFARAHLNLGALLASKGKRDAAIEQFQLAVQTGDPQIAPQAQQALQDLKNR